MSPSGETPVDRIRDTGYIPNTSDGYVIGENLAWGTYQLSTAQSIVAAWIASPGHLANILESQYRQTGVGVVPAVPSSLAEGAPGATYAQEFGVIVQLSARAATLLRPHVISVRYSGGTRERRWSKR